MQEHKPTTPPPPSTGEPAGQMDDINIPMVAVGVVLFGVVLTVTIIGLQAVIKTAQTREIQAKTLAQEDPQTELGKILQKQRLELQNGPAADRFGTATGSAPGSATAATTEVRRSIPIETAMQLVSREYGTGGAKP